MNKKFLSLGNQPLANDFKTKKINSFYTLNLKFDNKNKLVSISKRVKKEIMFNKTYPYRSSLSFSVQNHFKTLSKLIKKKCNFFKKKGCKKRKREYYTLLPIRPTWKQLETKKREKDRLENGR